MKKIFSPIILFLVLATLFSYTSCKKPSASFTVSSTDVMVGDVVRFTNTSTDNEKGYWLWDFGDGSSSTLFSPTHIYDQPGNYSVTLTATKRNGGSPSEAPAVSIKVSGPALPAAAFTMPDSARTGDIITFGNTSTNAVRFLWNFGDGASFSEAKNPTFVFPVAGTYNVSLKVFSANNDSAVTTKNIIIRGATSTHPNTASIIGAWTYKSRNVVDARAVPPATPATYVGSGSPYQQLPGVTNGVTTYNFTHTFSGTGNILQLDANQNLTNFGSFYIIDDTRILYNNVVCTYTLTATSLVIVREDKWTGVNYVDNSVSPPVSVTGATVIVTKTYTYQR